MTTTIAATEKPQEAPRRRRTASRGTIYKRGDGRWCGEINVPGEKRKYVYGATRADVVRKVTAAQNTVDEGGVLGNERLTIEKLLDRFLEERKARVRPSTHAAYSTLVNLHIKPRLGSVRARALTSADVQHFVSTMIKDKITPASAHHVLVVLRMALRLAVKWELIPRNVAEHVTTPKHNKPEIVPLSADDTRKLLEKAKPKPLGAVWFLAAALGLRRGEILGLTWDDVDLDRGRLFVRHQLALGLGLAPPKTKRGVRELALAAGVVASLNARKATQAAEKLKAGRTWENTLNLVFTTRTGHAVDGAEVDRWHLALCAEAEVRHVRLHDLRHGAATHMLAAGVDPTTLSASLGHAQVAFTMSTYTHALRPRLDDATAKLGAALGLG